MDFFEDIKVALRNHMEEELLPKFKRSSLFETIQKRMRTYDDIDMELLV